MKTNETPNTETTQPAPAVIKVVAGVANRRLTADIGEKYEATIAQAISCAVELPDGTVSTLTRLLPIDPTNPSEHTFPRAALKAVHMLLQSKQLFPVDRETGEDIAASIDLTVLVDTAKAVRQYAGMEMANRDWAKACLDATARFHHVSVRNGFIGKSPVTTLASVQATAALEDDTATGLDDYTVEEYEAFKKSEAMSAPAERSDRMAAWRSQPAVTKAARA